MKLLTYTSVNSFTYLPNWCDALTFVLTFRVNNQLTQIVSAADLPVSIIS